MNENLAAELAATLTVDSVTDACTKLLAAVADQRDRARGEVEELRALRHQLFDRIDYWQARHAYLRDADGATEQDTSRIARAETEARAILGQLRELRDGAPLPTASIR